MIDHAANPSFDAAATHRFYTEVLGARLRGATSGDSPEWGARYLLAAYDVEGAELDFFTYEGIARPAPDGLPLDIRHIGVAVQSAADLARVRARLDEHSAPYRVEHHHGEDDEHLYVRDPNGLMIEFSVAALPWTDRPEAADVLQRWIETQGSSSHALGKTARAPANVPQPPASS